MDRSRYIQLSDIELTPTNLEGAPVYGANDDQVGTVDHVHGTGTSASIVIDVGGFLGIGAKPVSVPIGDLEFMRDDDRTVCAFTQWTKDQLEAIPEHRD